MSLNDYRCGACQNALCFCRKCCGRDDCWELFVKREYDDICPAQVDCGELAEVKP